jgi:hypothetical protein
MASTPKPRPTDDEALFLISMRRERAHEVLSEFLHGFVGDRLKLPQPAEMLDYLTNTIMYLEMSLKLLSGNWESHRVDKMYQIIFGKPHPDPGLMEALQAATKNQKYLLSPAEGIIDHVPELEALGDALYAKLKSKYPNRSLKVDEELPDSFSRFLLDNAPRLFKMRPVTIPSGRFDDPIVFDSLARHQRQLENIQDLLGEFLANGHKLSIAQGRGGLLR